jgi:uncharacterized protein
VPNRLASEPSPYLRQHQDNPVDWWPWGPEAFAEARRRDVPVFLSIGYATCHWCHVMAHESFEDPEVAALMNRAFVNVKVDREERPDVDDAFMAVCQAMTGSGGWPLTVVMTPDRKPFLAATYLPRETRHGRIGMLELVPRIEQAWREHRPQLEAQAEHVLQHVRGEPHQHDDDGPAAPEEPAPAGRPDARTLDEAKEALARRFDRARGGFGAQPKFPSPHLLLFLLRHHHRTGDPQSLEMAERTLEGMARGGIRDHLGGGFHRYSTDAEWRVPHFEKMLYDQAMMALAFTEAHEATRKQRYADVVREALDYVLRDLADPEGGFRCAEDADSEGEEGKFYVWTRQEVEDALGADTDLFCRAYSVQSAGNFLDEATGQRTGTNILHITVPFEDLAMSLKVAPDALRRRLADGRAKLLAARAHRVRPLLDDKVLTDWNGLAIAAFAAAGRALQEPRYVEAARRAATFLRERMRGPGGRLRHRWHQGRHDELRFLDDHAFLLWGLVELYGATFEPGWLDWAVEVAGRMEQDFAHPEGGFWPTPHDGEDLGVRRREAYDGALPSGNGAAAHALLRLGLLTGDPRWTRLGQRALDAFGPEVARQPQAFAMLLCALDLDLGPTKEVVVAPGAGEEMLLAQLRGHRPRTVALVARPGLAGIAPWTAEHRAMDGRAAAYLCEGHACRKPTTDAAELAAWLG